ncbi:BMP family ABC transporter substrate-binding protein [Dactylosporangium roseum]|uniref:BMP family ABC transporter substrate-binding protein n=1 Tax=Dactylosporangium roseum TaxID=47989 RepID=A0ABY5YXS1_9ACTN|nr:BMP family ABC transporter substrate-binding protein [Dactylosporangium roseum]UWZ34566.1 BMP family ABC transporter substrate-binding protein [Dactylosporangium roseum]
MIKRTRFIPLGVAVAVPALLLTACASDPRADDKGSKAKDYSACMVTDMGGIDDRSFNAATWAGLQAVESKGVDISYVQSKSESDYAPNLSALVSKGCDLIISVGSQLLTATQDAAKAHPNQKFAIVDGPGNGTNLRGLRFNTAQSSFLAGYLAAGFSTTGKVATFGGQQFDSVTEHMDGYWQGVQYYNKVKGTAVQVLGWNELTQQGSFTGSFTDQTKGQQVATNFIQQGADVIYCVAGGASLGAPPVAQTTNGRVSIIWVDSDGYTTVPQYKDVFLTSVPKNIGGAVEETVLAGLEGKFPTEDYMGVLKNNGTGLSPFHNYDSKVNQKLRDEIEDAKRKIISGEIVITSPGQPK